MPLSIECENGHKLVCPETLAGSSVICPQCGSRVDVSARNVAKGGRAFSDSAKASISDIQKRTVTGAEPAGAKSAEISFTCPNGHRLSGPRSLQGQSGECPKCGIRFRVPLQDDKPKAALPSDEDDDISLEGIEEIDLSPPPPPPRDVPPSEASSAGVAQMPPRSLIEAFAELWRERDHGGLVELHLADGVAVAPDWWSEGHSTDEFGLFALQTGDGAYEIHAVPWHHVRRITVKGLAELPGGVFDV
jgi:Zn finger protein HypA/HybF involved in hydrogenase expression